MGECEGVGASPPESGTTPRRSLVICATQRSGSYYLCDLLNATGAFRPVDEIWAPAQEMFRRGRVDLPARGPFVEFARALHRRHTSAAGVYALKVLIAHFFQRLDQARKEMGDTSEAEVLESLAPRAVIVWLRRRDEERQAVSLYKALQTGIWRASQHNQIPFAPEDLRFSAAGIRQCLRTIQAENARFEQWLADHGRPAINLWHEDVRADPGSAVRKMAEALGVAVEADLAVRRVGREGVLGDALNEQWLARYRVLGGADPWESPASERRFSAAFETTEVVCVDGEVEHGNVVVTVTNEGAEAWPGGGEGGTGGWLAVSLTLYGSDGRKITEDYALADLEGALPAGGSTKVRLRVRAPARFGEYALGVRLFEEGATASSFGEVAPARARLRFVPRPRRAAAAGFFPAIIQDRGGWSYVQGFGHFYDVHFPWVLHQQHGWLEIDPSVAPGGWLRLYDGAWGEWVEASTRRPLKYRLANGQVWAFRGGDDEARRFELLGGGEARKLPPSPNPDPSRLPTIRE